MIETGIGRNANAALAGMSGFTLPGDISASDRFYRTDITEPVMMTEGRIAIWTGPGVSPEPIPTAIHEFTNAALGHCSNRWPAARCGPSPAPPAGCGSISLLQTEG